jgi:hypothetical protein
LVSLPPLHLSAANSWVWLDNEAQKNAPKGCVVRYYTEASMTKIARGLIEKRLANFGRTRCSQVFAAVSITRSEILAEARRTRFLDGRAGSPDAHKTQGELIGNGEAVTLSDTILGSVAARTLFTRGGLSSDSRHAPVVVLGDFFGACDRDKDWVESPEKERESSLLHEMIHVVKSWRDSRVFSNFEVFGLVWKPYTTQPITDWLMSDCTH